MFVLFYIFNDVLVVVGYSLYYVLERMWKEELAA
jgi:hypothetical protein